MHKQMSAAAKPQKRQKSRRPPSGRPATQHIVARTTGVESVVIKRREFVCPVESGVEFHALFHKLNPGNPDVFPLLWRDALNRAKYQFRRLNFHFVSRYGSVSTSGALGTVVMGVNPDVVQPAYGSVSSLLSTQGSRSEAPNKDFSISVSPAILRGEKYIAYSDTLPSGVDPHTYYLGSLQVAAEGQASGSELGQVFVDYEVELMGYKEPPAGASAQMLTLYTKLGAGDTGFVNSDSFGHWVGMDDDSILIGTEAGYSGLFFRDPGNYLVTFGGDGTTGTPSDVSYYWSRGLTPIPSGNPTYPGILWAGGPSSSHTSNGTILVENTQAGGFLGFRRLSAWGVFAEAVVRIVAMANYLKDALSSNRLRSVKVMAPGPRVALPNSSSSSSTSSGYPPPLSLVRDPPVEPLDTEDQEIELAYEQMRARKALQKK